jgi:putative phage-type endonuclease
MNASLAVPHNMATRQFSIGASEAWACLGMSKYKDDTRTDKWLEKIGEVDPREDEDENEAAEIGLALEDGVALLYERRTGRRVEKVARTLVHPKHSFLTCNLDRRVVGEPRLVELKTAGFTSHGYIDPDWGQEGTAEVPLAYLVQAQMQMEIDDKPVCDIPALLAGRGFKIYTVERNQELLDNVLIPGLVEFWGYVQRGEPPPMTTRAEAMKRYPVSTAVEVEATADVAHAIAELRDIKARIKADEAEEKAAENIIAAYMGEADTLTVDGYSVATFKTQSRAEHFVRESSTRVLRVKAMKSK